MKRLLISMIVSSGQFLTNVASFRILWLASLSQHWHKWRTSMNILFFMTTLVNSNAPCDSLDTWQVAASLYWFTAMSQF
jgi:hypothetical protein